MKLQKTLGWILVSLTTACAVEVEPTEADSGSDGDDPVEFRVAPVLAAEATVCPAWRQVVRRTTSDGNCLAVPTTTGTWTGTKLFGTTPGEYAKYCVYEFNGAPSKNDVTKLHTRAWVDEANEDCMVVTPQTGLDEVINPELHTLTTDRIDGVSETEIDLVNTEAGRAPIRVAAIDTTPPADPVMPRDDHGLVVAKLIESLAHGCSTPSTCRVIVDNVLGLPRYGPGRTQTDTTNGGFIAFQSEVAAAVHGAVRNWELSKTPLFQPKLIINLSVAWLKPFGGDPATSRPSVDAILLALRRASCQDALIIAAAGNEVSDCEPGPMLPADWERLAPPTPNECNAIGVAAPVVSPVVNPPLLYSVGGLDHEDEAILISREGGRPRLAALGDHVVGSDVTDSARTGTSMASATVAGIAALVWSYRGTLTSHEVAEIIWSSGVPTGETADYARAAPQEIRRATACRALEAACASPGTCPATFALSCVVDPLETDALHDVIAGFVPDSTKTIVLTEFGECPAYCGETVTRWAAPGAPAVCDPITNPARVDYLVAPQPTNPACPACNWVTSGSPDTADYVVTVNASLSGRYSQMVDTNVTVEMTLDDGSVLPFDLGNENLTTSSRAIELEPAPQRRVISGKIHIRFYGMSNPVSGDLLPPVIQ